MTSRSIMWFRRDLRLRDNPALTAALSDGDVLPLFVVDPAFERGGCASTCALARLLRRARRGDRWGARRPARRPGRRGPGPRRRDRCVDRVRRQGLRAVRPPPRRAGRRCASWRWSSPTGRRLSVRGRPGQRGQGRRRSVLGVHAVLAGSGASTAGTTRSMRRARRTGSKHRPTDLPDRPDVGFEIAIVDRAERHREMASLP